MAHHVVALALPGVVAFDLATAAQVFGHDEPQYRFSVATPAGGPVVSSTGFSITGTAGLEVVGDADTVIVPGYRPHGRPDPASLDALRFAHQRGARIASVCTGAFALAFAGILDGLEVTTHWQDTAELQHDHPATRVDPDVLYIDHGQVATSAGVAAGIDLCLHLVRRDHGEQLATAIARRMVVAPHRAGGQAQFIARETPPVTDILSDVTTWILNHLDADLSVAVRSPAFLGQ